ncbi:hypothetical protein P175DRAFT_0506344 [Aspergillus ochraceoroseus IBT 24754]|uniref:Uncharacterized protein n=1 Tax=Aspergillus ochraceoroseus IBT 24754 TaxID=1392256 RepID=A0A2T5M8B7_9EURO|nr:uncharacterized protein P175DRAFT_0506344 [Aspergillus ochraceoroseus IBT 24754]PTU24762.1 hypothetical protein P175DRAFT_0506344 [Aspergillus ochraceoroseus IBT 24754]
MWNWFSRTKQVPPKTEAETVIPLHSWDIGDHNQVYSQVLTFQFDAVLDQQVLEDAFQRLLQTGGWRKLGARLRKNDSGQLEYHIPSGFSEERPGVLFTSTKHDTKLQNHPVFRHLPQGTRKPSILPESTMDLLPFVTYPGSPRTIDDWLGADIPQLAIHTVTFENATLLTMTYPCTLTDATGTAAILQAWAATMRGKTAEVVPEFAGFREDPLERVGETGNPDQFVLFKDILSTWGTVVFVVRDLWDQFWYPDYEKRLLCVPGEFLTQMRTDLMQELGDDLPDGKDPFISEGDVLVAWWTRMAAEAHGTAPDRLLALLNIMGVRSLYLPARDGIYIGNAGLPCYTLLPAGEACTMKLSALAWRLRQCLTVQREREQIEAHASLMKRDGHFPLIGDPTMELFTFSNWHKGKFFNIDFSAARMERDGDLSPACSPTCIVQNVHVRGDKPLRFTGAVIVGKDPLGNWWVDTCMRKQAMQMLQRQLDVNIEDDPA